MTLTIIERQVNRDFSILSTLRSLAGGIRYRSSDPAAIVCRIALLGIEENSWERAVESFVMSPFVFVLGSSQIANIVSGVSKCIAHPVELRYLPIGWMRTLDEIRKMHVNSVRFFFLGLHWNR